MLKKLKGSENIINFLNLKYFVITAEELNITHVAQKLYISQQSLSNHIKKLENYFGVKLFERNAALSLTYAGGRLYDAATKILDIKHQLENEMLDIKKQRLGTLRIGISYTRGRVFLPEILPEFQEKNPLIEVSLNEGNSENLEDALLHGHIDLYIGSNIINCNEITTIDIQKERLFLVVPKVFMQKIYGNKADFCRNKHLSSVEIEAFQTCPFLMMTKSNRVRAMVDEYLMQSGLKLNVILETENIETLLSLAYKGMGITIYPEMFINHLSHFMREEQSTVDFFPISNGFAGSSLAIGYNNRKYLSYAAKDFISIVKKRYPNIT